MVKTMLSDCEQMVMKCIWDSDSELGVKELMEIVNEKHSRTWKLQTVSTFVARLVKKGYLDMYRNGRTFLYRPLMTEEDYKGILFRQYVGFWSCGNAAEFIRSLCESLELTDSDKKEIREVVQAIV